MNSLFHYLKKSAEQSPDKEAIVHGDVRLTYGEIFKLACSIASFLHEKGLKKGGRVSLLLDNSPEYVATYYGVLAAGGVVVGLNTATKARDLTNWITHSGSSWLVAHSKHPELNKILTEHSDLSCLLVGEQDELAETELLFRWQDAIATDTTEPDISTLGSNNQLAAIIYTSGTTGNPKGVTLSHQNLVCNTESIISYLGLVESDRVMNVLPFYYSYGNSVLHTHLAVGATVVLENSLLYPQKVLKKMQDERVTGFSGVPSTFSLLLSRANFKDYQLSSLRYITQAGGAMAPSNINRILNDLPDNKFFVMYGQTEATARLSYLPPERLKEKLGSIGIAIPGVSLEIRNEDGIKVSVGETGQICAKGPNIMQGYWNDPETTARTINDGWLMTGDLATYDDEGFIYITGRASEMIKSGANRISPKEIEEVISELEDVEEVAVVGIPDETLGEVIKAFIVISPGQKLEKMAIQAHCRNNLAMYKIPKFIEFVSELPKTASGKVKRYMLIENHDVKTVA